jgi:hypothetical protein
MACVATPVAGAQAILPTDVVPTDARSPECLYGEEYRADDARADDAALRAGRPLPPTPRYDE